jgi:hypothetical protein
MRPILVALGLLVGCQSQQGASNAQGPSDPFGVAFVSQCRFENGARILLAHAFGSRTYRFVIARNGQNEMTTISPGSNGALNIETNGGIGKINAVAALFMWLMAQPFKATDERSFQHEFSRQEVSYCPGSYPFSP